MRTSRLALCALVGVFALGAGYLVGGEQTSASPPSHKAAAASFASRMASVGVDSEARPWVDPVALASVVQVEDTAPARPARADVSPTLPDYAQGLGPALQARLGLSPEQAERVEVVLHEAEAGLEAELVRQLEAGAYDEVAVQHACERFEAEVLKRIEDVLPPDRVEAFRALLVAEREG